MFTVSLYFMERRPSSCKVKKKMDFISSTKDGTWIFLPSDSPLIARKQCLQIANERSVCKESAFTTQRVVIEFPERTPDCPETKAFSSFSHQRLIEIPMTRGRDEKFISPLRIWCSHAESVRSSYTGQICELRLDRVTRLASPDVGKQHRTNNALQSRGKWR